MAPKTGSDRLLPIPKCIISLAQLMKRNEQMYAMLSIAVSLFPQRIDDHVHSNLREKYGDRMLKMQRGDNATFEELFGFCCPKFVSPIAPVVDPENPVNLAAV